MYEAVAGQPARLTAMDGAGVDIHAPGAPGRELSDPAYAPFWARAEQTGALVFLHPFGCTLGERLDRWYLSSTVGQSAENAVALSHLIFGGVLDRHPGQRIIAAHGGGYLPRTSAGRTAPGEHDPTPATARTSRAVT